MSTIVEVKKLVKSYGKVMAVGEVSFSLEANKIYGLLGRNGAGKTTIMHILTAQLFATSGEVKVFGEDPYENQHVLSQICFIKESQRYPDNFTVADVMEISASFFPNWDREYALSLIEQFRLPLDRRMKKLSRGMMSSVGIVVGLASRAPLTIFDEPYLGLDAVARSLFYDSLIEDYAVYPRTIILSTHLIDEVSRILEHVMLIDDGKMIINEDADALRGRAFSIVGPEAVVKTFTAGKKILHQESLGGLSSAVIMEQTEIAGMKQAEALGLEVTAISLQQLVVYLTNGKSAKKAVTVI
ncbi:ABC transporter ATP-binding protein [Paenibacillus psychroresistens]|uniref:ABC transporter ATP-binding protein n=1 Tax=Paenibacillus psychroresistens TaxID=1778678 RepID=A0A6B8RV14_9BACL|nr:ABC transporter ATP-binding protein [Paenibacillus psychroresistens]QGQ99604.1 ABC transporter ATP-binding protein [Paenibacillus psychroresistens]